MYLHIIYIYNDLSRLLKFLSLLPGLAEATNLNFSSSVESVKHLNIYPELDSLTSEFGSVNYR